MKTSVLTTYEDFVQQPKEAWKVYLQAIEVVDKFAPVAAAMDRAKEVLGSEKADLAMVFNLVADQAAVIQKQTEALQQTSKVLEQSTGHLETTNVEIHEALDVAKEAVAQRDAAEAREALLEEKNARLQFRVLQLERMIFGSRSEKLTPEQLTQLRLELNAEEIATCSIVDIKDVHYKKFTTIIEPKKKHPGRNPLPAHLRREEIRLEPFDKKEGDELINEEVREVLEYNPGEFYVKAYIITKYAERHADGSTTFKQAEMPIQAIEKCIAGASLLAYIVISKYIDSLPLYRQIEIFKRVGVDIASGTISGWIAKVCELLEPLCDLLKREVLKAEYLNVDETTIKVMDKDAGKGKIHKGWYWVYLHHWGKLVFYDYKDTRSGKEPQSMLKEYNYTGYIQSDAYGAYESIAKKNGNILLACMAHARRRFEAIYKVSDKRAGAPLEMMNRLYGYEAEWAKAGLTFEEIKAKRQEFAIPILDEIEQWLKVWEHSRDIDATFRDAIKYTLKIWDKVRLYTTNGMLQIDNMAVERVIRTVAIGRKNYLFAGSHEGARRSGMLYSLMLSCKLNGINPQVYLPDVLTRLSYLPKEDKYLEMLLPNNWQPKLEAGSTNQLIMDK